MRLKTFTAATTADAMQMIRRELGDDAIIVSSRRDADGPGARVVAAVEEAGDSPTATPTLVPFKPASTRVLDVVRQALIGHGAPAPLIEMLANAAAAFSTADPILALAGALDGALAFAPLSAEKQPGTVMLVGAPGAGKTVTAAKLAHRAFAAGRSVGVISTDHVRAGGVEQLAAFTRILGIDLEVAPTPEKLAAAVARLSHRDALIIDAAQANPFDSNQTQFLAEMVAAAGAQPLLVLAAGGDHAEAIDQARVFRALGARAAIVTRLDATRRLGGVLAVAREAPLALAGVGDSPHVATGLSAINPVSLARRLMPRGSQAAPRDLDQDHAEQLQRSLRRSQGQPRRRAGAAS
ncbi:MAG: ATP-binding protein [Rhodospirillales bacterium]|nr:ATP-binding protein [Rhodospirillales bacterium]